MAGNHATRSKESRRINIFWSIGEYIIQHSSVKNKLMVLLFSFSSAGGWPLMLLPATRTKMTSRTSFIFVEFLEPYPCLCKHIFLRIPMLSVKRLASESSSGVSVYRK